MASFYNILRWGGSKERFEASFIPEPNSGCWIWVASARGPANNLRPILMVERKNISAYRYSFRAAKGEIPSGQVIRHSCHNSLCVNPDHLFAGTQKDNTDDMMRAGRHFSQGGNPEAYEALLNRAAQTRRPKMFCGKGHPMTADNTYEHPSGRHVCKACRRQFKNDFRQRRKAAQ